MPTCEMSEKNLKISEVQTGNVYQKWLKTIQSSNPKTNG